MARRLSLARTRGRQYGIYTYIRLPRITYLLILTHTHTHIASPPSSSSDLLSFFMLLRAGRTMLLSFPRAAIRIFRVACLLAHAHIMRERVVKFA